MIWLTFQLILNGNKVSWRTVANILEKCPAMTELRLSNNNLGNPDVDLVHESLSDLFLSGNPITSFSSVVHHIVHNCPSLESLSMSECPISRLDASIGVKSKLRKLNLSDTAVREWSQVDLIKSMTSIQELRMMDCPYNQHMDEVDRRQHMIARLPNILTLNGGDQISEIEREQAERAFIRHFLDMEAEERPERWSELVQIHGQLDPLVKIDLTPETVFSVGVWFKDSEHLLHVSVRQRVKHFKSTLSKLFPVSASCMRLWYYDQDLWQSQGPQEMKWPMKGNKLMQFNQILHLTSILE